MSVTSFIGQCFQVGMWGLCSRKTTVNKYVQKAATRKWKYRDGKNDDEADGVVDVGDLAELEYSIVEQQPNAMVLKFDDQEPHRQESYEGMDTPTTTISALLEGTEEGEEEELVTSPRVMSDIEEETTKRSSSITSEKALIQESGRDDTHSLQEVSKGQTEEGLPSREKLLTSGEELNQTRDKLTYALVRSSSDLPRDINENIVVRHTEDNNEDESASFTKSDRDSDTNNVNEETTAEDDVINTVPLVQNDESEEAFSS